MAAIEKSLAISFRGLHPTPEYLNDINSMAMSIDCFANSPKPNFIHQTGQGDKCWNKIVFIALYSGNRLPLPSFQIYNSNTLIESFSLRRVFLRTPWNRRRRCWCRCCRYRPPSSLSTRIHRPHSWNLRSFSFLIYAIRRAHRYIQPNWSNIARDQVCIFKAFLSFLLLQSFYSFRFYPFFLLFVVVVIFFFSFPINFCCCDWWAVTRALTLSVICIRIKCNSHFQFDCLILHNTNDKHCIQKVCK